MPGVGVQWRGTRAFRLGLAQAGPEFPREFAAANREIAKEAAGLSRGYASRMGGVQAKAAKAIKGRGTTREARISVASGIGSVAFWGAKKRTGWYARSQYNGSPAQHPEWVGNTWDVAAASGGPYAINRALHDYLDELDERYLEVIDRVSARAYPLG